MSGPSPDRVAAAAARAQARADAAARQAAAAEAARQQQVTTDQAWLDTQTANMSDADKDELFRAASANCAGTTMTNGRIVIACPLPRKMLACVSSDPYDCGDRGHVNDDSSKGCKMSASATASMSDESTGTATKVGAPLMTIGFREKGMAWVFWIKSSDEMVQEVVWLGETPTDGDLVPMIWRRE